MSRPLVCPACGEEEDLTGDATPDGIEITCGRCGAAWPRDAGPATCASCGGTEIEHRPQAVTAYSRGTQVSIVGWRQVPLCVHCDAEMLSRSLAGKPVPHAYVPAAVQRGDRGDGDTTILPR